MFVVVVFFGFLFSFVLKWFEQVKVLKGHKISFLKRLVNSTVFKVTIQTNSTLETMLDDSSSRQFFPWTILT